MSAWIAGSGTFDPAARTVDLEPFETFDLWSDAAGHLKVLVRYSAVANPDWELHLKAGVAFIYNTPDNQFFFLQEV